MSINSELKYLNFLKKSGLDSFLQNTPTNHFKFHSTKELKNPSLKKKLDEIYTIDELESYFDYYDKCSLKKNANNTVFADGNPNSQIMLIGEAPGAEEDKQGIPFVGAAGELLNKMLLSINLTRNSVYITNVVPWRPPNNRTPTDKEILECMPLVQKHIEIIHPSMIILLGGTASKAILASTLGITKIRGKWYDYKSPNLKSQIIVRAIYHPAFLLRSPSHKKEAWIDLKEIQKKLEN